MVEVKRLVMTSSEAEAARKPVRSLAMSQIAAVARTHLVHRQLASGSQHECCRGAEREPEPRTFAARDGCGRCACIVCKEDTVDGARRTWHRSGRRGQRAIQWSPAWCPPTDWPARMSSIVPPLVKRTVAYIGQLLQQLRRQLGADDFAKVLFGWHVADDRPQACAWAKKRQQKAKRRFAPRLAISRSCSSLLEV